MSQAIPPYAHGPSPRSAPEFDIGRVYGEGWGTMSSRYGLLLGAAVVFILIEIGIAIVVGVIERANPVGGLVLNFVSTFLVNPPFAAGLFFLGVQVHRGEPVALEAMFSGFSRYGVVIGINALFTLLVLLALIPPGLLIGVGVAISSGAGSAAGIGFIVAGVAIAFGLILFISVRLAFATVVCLDPKNGYTGVIESLTLCWRATAPVAWKLLLLYLLVVLTMFGTMLLLCVGLFFLGYPFGIAVAGASYCAIFSPLHQAVDANIAAPPIGDAW